MPANAYKTGASDKPCAKYSSQIRHTLTTFPALPKFTYSLSVFCTRLIKFELQAHALDLKFYRFV